jgi:hypothetical protein
MATDPLEKATRDAKRNLLLVSVAIITIKVFNVSIQQIPLGGLSINFDPAALGLLLSAGLLYFLVTFVLYYYIDVRNVETTKHQEEHAKQSNEAPKRYQSKLNYRIAEKIEAVLSKGQSLATVVSGPPRVAEAVRPTQIFGGRPNRVVVDISETTNKNSFRTLTREHDATLFERIDDVIARNARTFWWRIQANKAWHRISSVRVVWTYYFRTYFVDGAFPALLALYAIAGLFDLVSLDWIKAYSPTIKTAPLGYWTIAI